MGENKGRRRQRGIRGLNRKGGAKGSIHKYRDQAGNGSSGAEDWPMKLTIILNGGAQEGDHCPATVG